MDFDSIANRAFKKKTLEEVTEDDVRQLVSVTDLTLLRAEVSEADILNLCLKAHTPFGPVAAVCINRNFVSLAAQHINNKEVKIVSVANFPTGRESLAETIDEIHKAIESGANEMDVVFPYSQYLSDKKTQALDFVKECRVACGQHVLKIILEISEFEELETVYYVSKQLIDLGVDFIKTSTGRSKHGATLEASSVMLLAISSCKSHSAGFKASGGINTIKDAISYLDLAKELMGNKWVTPQNFRLGSSSLIANINSTYKSKS